jgi:CRP/FNR family transcriptional regulator, cyclic AMP receptor protein
MILTNCGPSTWVVCRVVLRSCALGAVMGLTKPRREREGAWIMGIGTRDFDAFRSGTGRDHLDGHLALNSPGRCQLGCDGKEDLGPPGASVAAAASMIEEKRWIRAGLAESDVFGALADAELDRLIVQGGTETYAGGAIVFRKGDPADQLLVVLDGRIRLSSAASNGKEVLFDFIGPGRCFGEVALLDGTTRKLDATAVKTSAVFTLGRSDVLACLEAHPEIAVRIIRVLCARLNRAMEMLEDRTQHALSSRSARTLLRLASEYGDGMRIDLRISQSEIAGLVGATREKVNRQLCAWCRCGILAIDEGHLLILDHSALRAIAEDD